MLPQEKPISSIAILGAGAMGCLFGARFALQGKSVTMIDVDRDRIAALNRDGITLIDDQGRRTVRVRAALAADVGPVDLVLLLTKGRDSLAAIRSVAHLRESRPIALTLQNGVGNAELLADGFDPERVLVGTAHLPSDLIDATSVETHGFAIVDLGGFTPGSRSLAPKVAELIKSAGFEANVIEDINAAVWEKVAFNAALNAPGMVCQVANGGLDNEPGRRLAFGIAGEAVAVAAAAGVDLDDKHILAKIDGALREHSHHKASMLQDRERNRQTEIETINGAISREGARRGVATPICDTLADLVRVIDASAKAR